MGSIRHHATEQTVLFLSIIKWTILALLTGTVVGAAIHYFIVAIDVSNAFVAGLPFRLLLLPLGLMVSTYLVQTFAPDAKGHGTEKVIEAVHKKSGKIKPETIPIKVLATIVTIATGGSVGKEGPSAQIGSGIASLGADFLHLDSHDRKKIVICGISAGFAAIFGTPIGGAIFGVEVLFVGKILYDVLLPSLIAGITSYEVVTHLGTKPFHDTITKLPPVSDFATVFMGAIVFGLGAFLFIKTLSKIEHTIDRIKIPPLLKSLIGGLVLAGLSLLLGSQYLGLGTQFLQSALTATRVPWYSFAAKILFSDLTLALGGSGGVIAPIFIIGATLGNTFAYTFGLNPRLYAALGMVGVVAAATNAPIASILIASEIFGPAVLLPAAITATVSFLINGHNSIYPSQVLAMRKTRALDVEVDQELSDVESKLSKRGLTIIKAAGKAKAYLLDRYK